jgi:hypothetical protein
LRAERIFQQDSFRLQRICLYAGTNCSTENVPKVHPLSHFWEQGAHVAVEQGSEKDSFAIPPGLPLAGTVFSDDHPNFGFVHFRHAPLSILSARERNFRGRFHPVWLQ